MRARTALTVVSLAAAALVAPAVSAHAATAPVKCGDTISGSVTLTGNLYCRGDKFLTLLPGASLDLGGHKVTSDSNVAIVVPRAGNVTVSDGTVSSFITGIRADGDTGASPSPIRLTGLVIAGNGLGVAVNGDLPTDLQISDSTFIDNGNYAVYARSAAVTIRDSSFSGSVDFPDTTVGVVGAAVTISNSTFRGFSAAVECFLTASGCSVTDSVLQDCDTGVLVSVRGAATIRGNRFIRCTEGVSVTGSKGLVTITRNRFRQGGVAVRAVDADVSITHNDVRDGTTGVVYRHTSARVRRPVAVVSFNTFTGNHDGIDIDVPAAVAPVVQVGGNAAIDNVDYGINAPGVTDRGGNTASGNGHDPQCVGVVCA